ncbi:EscU/YscU/HrcU family type III secretion system export apparatus switch protein [Sphingomonas sp. 1P06PA]|uniref:EscU/YscU/HrcU family type III secretion system export apparatus switch protein n=1 Tax=Sphingomonas sp. 1P06PA TaxID=554121 RepID=UPI0039A48019
MADKNQGGDKTEKPTPKRLQDARKKGDVAKSKDLSATVGLIVWLVVLLFGAGFAGQRIAALFTGSFELIASNAPFASAAGTLGQAAFHSFVLITALAMIPAAAAGVMAEFFQTGGVFTGEKLKPTLDKMNPAEGIKRMFSMDNLVELAKTLAKAALILFITWLILRASLAEIIGKSGVAVLPTEAGSGRAEAAQVLGLTGELTRTFLLWTLFVFVVIAALDMGWQRKSYIKKLMMSHRDLRDEAKESEGDPQLKANRRQLHQEWANQNSIGAARDASVLVVNPTHIAIALDYDPDECPVPILAAKGEGPLAKAMREAAQAAGVPIIRNIEVARGLFDKGAVDEVVPRDMFDAIAEIIIWADRERHGRAVPAGDDAMKGSA